MASEFDAVFEDIFSLEDFVKIMSHLQLEDDDKCETQLADSGRPTEGQQIPVVLTGRRARARSSRPLLTHPYSTETYRAKILTRSLLQDPILLLHDEPTASLQKSQLRAPQHRQQMPTNNHVQDSPQSHTYSTEYANHSAWLSSLRSSYHKDKPATDQYLQEPSRNVVHSSPSSLYNPRTQTPNRSRRVKSSTLPPPYPSHMVHDSYLNFPYSKSTTSSNDNFLPSQFQFTNSSNHKDIHFPSSYNSALPNQNFQYLPSMFQNSSASSGTIEDPNMCQFPYNTLHTSTADQSVQFPYNVPSYSKPLGNDFCELSQNTLPFPNQTLNTQVLNRQRGFNYLSNKSANPDFSSQLVQDSFQTFPNLTTTLNDSVQFPYSQFLQDSSLVYHRTNAPPFSCQNNSSSANQRVQVPQFSFQNDSASTNQRVQAPPFSCQNNSSSANKRVQVPQFLFQNDSASANQRVQPSQFSFQNSSPLLTTTRDNECCNFPYSTRPPNHSILLQSLQTPSNHIVGSFRQLSHNIPSADQSVKFSSSQWQSAPANPCAQTLVNTTDSTNNRLRMQRTQQSVRFSVSTNNLSLV